MKYIENVLNLVGNTPLVRLKWLGKDVKPNIYAKLESSNPSGSVKDRMAHYVIEQAEKEGILEPGGTIVENSSGNTGTSLAMISAVKGYKCIITMPDKTSLEKQSMVSLFGAKVVITPTEVPYDSEESYYSVAKRIAKEIPHAYYMDQYNNPRNIECHYRTTGPEIWSQTQGKIDCLVAGIGTGGTLSGIARFLKEQNKSIYIVAVDPVGSIFYEYFKTGKIPEFSAYKVEGLGEDYLVKSMDFSCVDEIVQVTDIDSFLTAREVAKQEGIFMGGSSGSAMYVARDIARQNPHFKNIITILPDSGARYLSKMYNDHWMKANGFLQP